MKSTHCSALILALAAATSLAAVAEERSPRQASEPVQVVAPAQPAAAAEPGAVRSSENCVRETGTRIRAGAGREGCRFAGRSYTRDNLQQTGETDVGRALQRLDPSIRGGRW